MSSSTNLAAVQQRCLNFLHSQNTLCLATVDSSGQPHASHAPFILAEKEFWVLLSNLARHGPNLRSEPRCSVMLVENPGDASNPFACQRLQLDGVAKPVSRQAPVWPERINAMEAVWGATVRVISTLKDFDLFRISILSGRYVEGFGQAFAVNGPGMTIEPLPNNG